MIGCHLRSLGVLRQHTELHYIGWAKFNTYWTRTQVITPLSPTLLLIKQSQFLVSEEFSSRLYAVLQQTDFFDFMLLECCRRTFSSKKYFGRKRLWKVYPILPSLNAPWSTRPKATSRFNLNKFGHVYTTQISSMIKSTSQQIYFLACPLVLRPPVKFVCSLNKFTQVWTYLYYA